jgi:tetratricopeptide (TPR) repeat protein
MKNFSLTYISRYKSFGDLKDLEAAIQNLQEVVDLTPERAGQLAKLASLKDRHQLAQLRDLSSLGVSLTDKYRRSGVMEDLEGTLKKFQETASLCPRDHPTKATHLRYLAVSFRDRYQRLGALEDLEFAFQNMQEAVYLSPIYIPLFCSTKRWVGLWHAWLWCGWLGYGFRRHSVQVLYYKTEQQILRVVSHISCLAAVKR